MNIIDLYSTRIQKNFDDDNADILAILKANAKKQFKLINYYKGMPLSYPASIVSIDKGIVDFDVRKEQAFAIEDNRSVFIRSDIFKHDVFARVQYVNVKKGAASFVKFTYVEILAERRNFIRMEPKHPLAVIIDSPFGIFDGTLQDISIIGLNVLIKTSIPLEIDTTSMLQFHLWDSELNQQVAIDVPAKLMAIKGDSLPRNYKFTISPEKTLERQISKYIFQRQIEVVKEIKDVVS